ncbi:hypothetical protein CYLTODRAFT_204827 [Cylindrobasidium torrendii FP15055 ss-10]|uniref:Uncharacterized protein n=1 Tax=Cylindrobasidium torrendii FP15055 ss-10 TaxID=1314674 RepID=A0A0D7AUB9_9AGAR|nr:hypothetical protein CYLTODRAFT_204827 [Cylindrobasidium torrendii FP15055 ss-10]
MLPLFDITQRPLTEGGWHGWPRHGIKRRTDRDIDELVTCGIQIYSLENSAGADVPILDRNLRRWGLYRCVDQSSDGQARQAEQTESMKIAAGSTRWKDGGRGNFGVGRDGVMHEQGTQRPWRPANTPKQRDAMQLIFDNEAWKKDAQQSDIAWQTFNPTMHKLHCDVRKALEYQFDDLHWNWDTLPQGLTTFNFGPQVVCRDHADPKDFPTWANLKAFGDFDHKRGGHVVFWDLGIAIELPPGAEIWFPSALLLHSNTVIGKHETRYSATSYSSGGAFQWVYRGGLWPEYHDEAFPDVAELNEHRAAAFWDIAFPVWN